MTDIDRHNWKAHCQAPQLTADEWRRWEAVAQRIRADCKFADSVFEATEAEWQAEQAAGQLDGWAGLAQWADAARRYKRAAIRRWRHHGKVGQGKRHAGVTDVDVCASAWPRHNCHFPA